MSDIVQRLRTELFGGTFDTMREAAARIEELEAELKLTKEQHNKGGGIILELAAHIEKLKEPVEWWEEQCRQYISRIETLEAALRFILTDPPAALDEPDTDVEIIQHYREVARTALGKDTGI